jgi:uncharacterized membrane protein
VRWRARLGDLVHIIVITFIAAIVNAALVYGFSSMTVPLAVSTRRPVRAPLAGFPVQ